MRSGASHPGRTSFRYTVTMAETTRALWPFFGVAIALLLAVSYVPALTIRF